MAGCEMLSEFPFEAMRTSSQDFYRTLSEQQNLALIPQLLGIGSSRAKDDGELMSQIKRAMATIVARSGCRQQGVLAANVVLR
ncbi:hypothetical protein ACH5RR_007005 [Cinchona calisaya]|uniref:Uncharacterized protein n=1 Tax=Cinchona calisaya TaxID=153742 RepID=A0ABD3AQP4_9GENT